MPIDLTKIEQLVPEDMPVNRVVERGQLERFLGDGVALSLERLCFLMGLKWHREYPTAGQIEEKVLRLYDAAVLVITGQGVLGPGRERSVTRRSHGLSVTVFDRGLCYASFQLGLNALSPELYTAVMRVDKMIQALLAQQAEWKNELVRMKMCGELGGPKEAMVRKRLEECEEALQWTRE